MSGLRALFLASPHPVAAAVMRGWLDGGNTIAGLWYPDRQRKGLQNADKRLGLFAPRWSVAAVCARHQIPVTMVPPMRAWGQRMEAVRQSGANVLVSVYFMDIVPPDVIGHFAGKCVNFHPAPLPQYRGPTPIEAMIADCSLGDKSCMTLHVLDKGIDSGAIIAAMPVSLGKDGSLVRHMLDLAKAARKLARTALPDYLEGHLSSSPQDERLASYVRITPSDLELSSALTSDEAEWRLKTIGRKKYLLISGLGDIRICAFSHRLSPPAGKKPDVGFFSFDLDLMDARVRVKRRMPWTKHVRKVSDLWTKIYVKDEDETGK